MPPRFTPPCGHSRTIMLYICLRFPLLGLDALTNTTNVQPCALVDGGRVQLLNRAAKTAGVTASMSLTTAIALCPELHCRQRDRAREQHYWHQLALWAYRFSDDVSLSPPNALLLEVSRSLRLFGNLQRLYRTLLSAYRKRGLQLRVGIGNTPMAAELLSRQGIRAATLVNARGELQRPALKNALAAAPSRHLPLAAPQLSVLHNMGLRRVGDVLSLPRKELLSAFDDTMADTIERLTGRRSDPRPRFQPSEHFHTERQFDGGLQQCEQLRLPISAMLRELEIYLRLRQRLNRDLHWSFHFLDGHHEHWQTPVSLRHFQQPLLLELVMLQLQHVRLPGPVERLTLTCRDFIALETPAEQLFDCPEQGRQQDAMQQLFAKLQLRLGEHTIQRLASRDALLPEHQGIACPSANYQHQRVDQQALRPSWLLTTPLELDQQAGKLCWRAPLEILQGPERLDSHWWQQRQVRDYYIAQHRDHGLCWLFKDCLSQRWYLHGFFS